MEWLIAGAEGAELEGAVYRIGVRNGGRMGWKDVIPGATAERTQDNRRASQADPPGRLRGQPGPGCKAHGGNTITRTYRFSGVLPRIYKVTLRIWARVAKESSHAAEGFGCRERNNLAPFRVMI